MVELSGGQPFLHGRMLKSRRGPIIWITWTEPRVVQMALKLTIIDDQRSQSGQGGSIVFGVGGGGIGRAHDNDWVLPDPQRYLSAHHARVQFRDGPTGSAEIGRADVWTP